jgi:hypothetical protein
MKKLLILMFLLLPLAGCAEKQKVSMLDETLKQMLVLIDQNKDKELLTKYADMSKHGADQVGIPAEKLPELKVALLVAQKLKPLMLENNTVAVFENQLLKRPMKFVLLKGVWRLQN